MSSQMLIAFTVASLVLLVIPGPTILTVISYSITKGKKAVIPLVAAVTLGDSTAIFLSLVGLGTILAKSAFLFEIIKTIGGLYLLYLGLKMLISGVKAKDISLHKDLVSSKKLFLNTYIVTALNPKGIVFFISFLPQFINPNGNVNAQLLTCAVIFVSLGTINAVFYALFASKAKDMLTSHKSQRRFNIFGGSLLSIAGIWALSAKRV